MSYKDIDKRTNKEAAHGYTVEYVLHWILWSETALGVLRRLFFGNLVNAIEEIAPTFLTT